MRKLKICCAVMILTPSIAFGAETHPDVKEAMSYNLPEITCNRPKPSAASRDPHKLGRFERAQKRWLKCVKKHKKVLVTDFVKLKASASHGLTDEQAKLIMQKLSEIQSAVESPTGVPLPKAEDS